MKLFCSVDLASISLDWPTGPAVMAHHRPPIDPFRSAIGHENAQFPCFKSAGNSGDLLRGTWVRVLALILFAAIVGSAAAAPMGPGPDTTKFAVTRDGSPIGTTTIRVSREGDATIVRTATHIAVKIAFITVYRYDETETDRWAGDRLIAMRASTDDNGTIHNVEAWRTGDALSVEANGMAREIVPSVIPANPWNAALVRQNVALNPQSGQLTSVSVVDRGEDQLILDGRPTTAHHYTIMTTFPQDVWYDQSHRLVKVEMHGSDGSTIQYRPG
jgi:hypothetical protein